MRVLLLPLMLAGCQLVFTLDEPAVQTCAGNSPNSLTDLCVGSTREEIGLIQLIDTGDRADPTDLGDCDSVVEQQVGTEVCVISAQTIQIGNTIVIGARPLVLVSATDLVVTGTLSAASHLDQPGPGASFACPGDLAGRNTVGFSGGAGGAGGSFGAIGGDGGDGNGVAGGDATLVTSPLSFIRGGCAGGSGGDRLEGTPAEGGVGGDSGGAIYLVAKRSITIEGTLDASGAGGGGGAGASNTGCGGGGGGGSGGLIALDAPSIVLASTAKLVANGGGGGAGGGPNNTAGAAGENPNTTTFPFPASGGVNGLAGDGGNGANALDLGAGPGANSVSASADAGAGGGGGSTGFVLILGVLEGQGQVSPPPQID